MALNTLDMVNLTNDNKWIYMGYGLLMFTTYSSPTCSKTTSESGNTCLHIFEGPAKTRAAWVMRRPILILKTQELLVPPKSLASHGGV